MIAHIAALGVQFVVLGLVIAFGAALTVFIVTTPVPPGTGQSRGGRVPCTGA
ncbi:hypothetical protein [Arthrobacter antioxidans]|uniref:hypothetical protein n=1 Tax=Arthrobacter antioxidans TaxID=2895818 RepID=UPI001FFEF1CF|nr:hypothetical protein [Arthrobacter antioxidans]